MRLTACLAATLLFAANASAHQGKASAQGPTEEFATAQAMRLVPKGATIPSVRIRVVQGIEIQLVGCQ